MKTTKEKKDAFISSGSEIEEELKEIFGKEERILKFADIGACDGLSTVIYSRMFPNARFYVFEPVPENYREMIDNFLEYSITGQILNGWQVALGRKNGKVIFYKSSGQVPGVENWDTGNKSGSLLRPRKHLQEHKWCEFKETFQVEVRSLDSFDLEIDFAHIDVQGAELEVLKGAERTLRRMKALWIEVANIDLYANQPLKRDIANHLKGRGFVCTKDTCGNRKYGDMLWVRQ